MSDKGADRTAKQKLAAKQKLEPTPESCIIIDQPLVRDYSTGGGHGPEETLVEGDEKLVTRKWQGYPPKNLNLIGKPHPAMTQVGIPRLTGKAEYTTRIHLPNMLYTKLVTSPHPRAKVKVAGRFPGGKDARRGAYPDAAECSERPIRFRKNFSFRARWLPLWLRKPRIKRRMPPRRSRWSTSCCLTRRAWIRRWRRTRRIEATSKNPAWSKTLSEWGDVEKAFAQADIVKEFEYRFGGGLPVPLQPNGCIAKWDGDKVTIWGMGQNIYPIAGDHGQAAGHSRGECALHRQMERRDFWRSAKYRR